MEVLKKTDDIVTVGEYAIKKLDASESIKTLGVYLNPMLEWKDEFSYVKKKMEMSMQKLMGTKMAVCQVHVCFNAHMLTHVFYGCGIVYFNKEQCDVLKKTYEGPLVKKLRLVKTFPRTLLHVRKGELGVGLMEPQTVVDVLACKMHIGNRRSTEDLGRIIEIHEESGCWKSGMPKGATINETQVRHCNEGWTEEVHDKLRKRGISIKNETSTTEINTVNKHLMEHALQYV